MNSDRPWVLGISASHNGAVCLLHGEEIVAAIQEERLTRVKRHRTYASSPTLSIQYCLEAGGITAADLDLVVVNAQGHLADAENDVRLNPALRVDHHETPVLTLPHHAAHAYSAFACSGFTDAAVLIVDGHGSPLCDLPPEERSTIRSQGSWEHTSLYDARDAAMRSIEKHMCEHGECVRPEAPQGMNYPRSFGGLFAAAARQIFGDFTEAGKVMGLAPYGRATIPVTELFEIRDGMFVFKDEAARRFEHAERWPAHQEAYQDLAASVQAALEVGLLELCARLRRASRSDNLCLAGGVALNSVANERIAREAGFARTYFFPAAEDSGVAVGAAYFGLWKLIGRSTRRPLAHDAMGRSYPVEAIEGAVARTPAIVVEKPRSVVARAVELLCEGHILGWFDGRSELGPRALGQRSILCDPRRPNAKERLNARVKHREMFRPFAPAVLASELSAWFEAEETDESPYMLRVLPFRPGRAQAVPAVVHVDGTGRVQTVTERNGLFHALVREFYRVTGVPIVLNTSFNVAGEPIVETPDDALWALLYTDLDHCVFADRIVSKRPGLSSILELVPSLAARGVAVEKRLEGGRWPVEGALDPALVFQTSTPWGPATARFPGAVEIVLRHVDGRRTGHDILERVRASEGDAISEPQLTRLFGALRRQYVLAFRAPDA